MPGSSASSAPDPAREPPRVAAQVAQQPAHLGQPGAQLLVADLDGHHRILQRDEVPVGLVDRLDGEVEEALHAVRRGARRGRLERPRAQVEALREGMKDVSSSKRGAAEAKLAEIGSQRSEKQERLGRVESELHKREQDRDRAVRTAFENDPGYLVDCSFELTDRRAELLLSRGHINVPCAGAPPRLPGTVVVRPDADALAASRIPAAARTRTSPSTPTRPRAAASRAS